ncbi:tol-pal system protein YbgF [Candidatus Njordibacter sp. Uisw_058]|uniref:tol-pal system protein YbgF n=1 Tax=Candidatus Njordibacter sp. Uisw_058 TaxID=3230974 RepID=UPI003D5B3190
MSQTNNPCALLLFILAVSVEVRANTAVPVTDLVNDTAAQSNPSPQSMQADPVTPVTVDLVTNAGNTNANAQIFDLVEMLQQEVQQLRGQVEELNYNLGKLKEDQKQRYLDLDRRIVSLSTAAPVTKESRVAPVTDQTTQPKIVVSQVKVISTAVPVGPATETSTTETQTLAGQAPNDPEAAKIAYKAAYALIRKRQFDASIVALLAFVKTFPQSDLVGNAYYWLGEVYMVQGDASLAVVSFENVISKFPQHRKIPDALYKAGVAYQNTGNVDKANQLLQRVLAEYPESSAARLALEKVN